MHQTKSVPNRTVLHPQDLLHAQVTPVKHGALPTCPGQERPCDDFNLLFETEVRIETRLIPILFSHHICAVFRPTMNPSRFVYRMDSNS